MEHDHDFPNEDESLVADILLQLPMLIGKSNLTLFLPSWVTKGRRSAINRSPSPPPPSSPIASRAAQLPSPHCGSTSATAILCNDSALRAPQKELPSSKTVKTAPLVVNKVRSELEKDTINNDGDSRFDPQGKRDVLANSAVDCGSESKLKEDPSIKYVRKAPSKKTKIMELRKQRDELHSNKRVLEKQLQIVKDYYQKLMAYHLKLLDRREELSKSNEKYNLNARNTASCTSQFPS